jgi:hypothetical protein
MTHCHISSANNWICYPRVECRDTSKLHSTIMNNERWILQYRSNLTYPANEDRTVCTIKNMKNANDIGDAGNQYTVIVDTSASSSLGQNAIIHGRKGLSPRDHRPATQPANIWKGKSIRTATARSSRPRPFSTIFSCVTASLAAQPILAKRCKTQRTWISKGEEHE